MSADETRIQSPDGEWATLPYGNASATSGAYWIPQDLINALALAARDPDAPDELSRLCSLLAPLPVEPGPFLRLPHTPESQARFDRLMAREALDIARGQIGGRWSSSITEKEMADELKKTRSRLDVETAPCKRQSWLNAPRLNDVRWSSDPGRAALLSPEIAAAFIQRCQILAEIASLLPIAVRQARVLGAVIAPTLIAQTSKLGASIVKVGQSKAVVFAPEREYLSRQCFAVYAQTPLKKGFATAKNRELKPDLASARLFPNAQDAKLHGERFFGDFALVTVDIAPLRFESHGKPASLSDLASAISAREALDIDKALHEAAAERLQAELDRRSAQASPSRTDRARL